MYSCFALQRSSFVPAFNPKLLRQFEDMEENVKTKKEQMIDSRGPARFFNITTELDDGKIEEKKEKKKKKKASTFTKEYSYKKQEIGKKISSLEMNEGTD